MKKTTLMLAILGFWMVSTSWAQSIIHLTNVPGETTAPKEEPVAKAGTVGEQKLTFEDPDVQAAFVAIDDMLLAEHSADPFFKTKVRLFSKLGPKLLNTGIPPQYWPQTVDFAYSALTAQTQHMLKALHQMETLIRTQYEKELALHRSNPRLHAEPMLNLDPVYWLRRQLIELSAP